MKKSDKFLTCREQIRDWLGVSDHILDHFRKLSDAKKIKLPVLIINGKWYAHTDNLDDFTRRITANPNIITTAEKNGA